MSLGEHPFRSQPRPPNPEIRPVTHPQRPDAIVIGGGPGGSTVATLLARRGCSVVLLERERFPRRHVGESLLPASMPVLEDLGVLDQVEAAGFPKKWGATMVWGADPEPWSWYFKETNRSYPHAYQVWRPAFDEILLDNARAAGVDVRGAAHRNRPHHRSGPRGGCHVFGPRTGLSGPSKPIG